MATTITITHNEETVEKARIKERICRRRRHISSRYRIVYKRTIYSYILFLQQQQKNYITEYPVQVFHNNHIIFAKIGEKESAHLRK